MMTDDKRLITDEDVDVLAEEFFDSQYVDQTYMDWPLDQRVNAYLVHHASVRVATSGDVATAILDRVMARIGAQHR